MMERRKRRIRERLGRAAAGEQPSRTAEAGSDASPPNAIEEAYRALVEQSLQGLFIFQDGQVVFANQAMADITGYSVDELIALSPEQVYTLVHPDDREAVWSRYRRRMAGQAALQRYEFRSLHKDGGVRWLEAHASLIEYAGRPAVQAAYVDITSRKRAEESLRASEDRYRSLFDNAVLGIYRTTPDGRILAANPALLRMLGYDSLEDLTQRNLEEEGFEAGYPRSLFKELMESQGEAIGLESAWTRRDGTTVHIRESAVVIRDEAGKSRYYEGTVEDISDRKQAEAARKLSHRVLEISNRSTMREPMLQQIVLEIRDFAQCENAAIRILDEDGNIPYEAFVGFSREFYERESPLSVQRDHCMCIRVIQGQTDPTLPFFTPRGSFFMNGTTRFLAAVPAQEKGQTRNVCNATGFESVALIPIQSNGQIVGLIHVADRRENRVPLSLVEPLEDVAMQLGVAVRRTMAEEALRRSEQDKSLILNSTSETFAYLDLDLRIQWGNRMLEQSLGLRQEQIVGRHCYELRHQRTTPCDHCPLIEAIRTGKPQEAEVCAPDGQVLFLRGFPLLADDGRITGVVEIGENTTARKRAQQALQESEAKFRAIADYTGDVEIWTGPDGQLIWINPAIERFTGYTVSECMAMPDFPASLIHVEDRPRMLGLYQQACAGSSGNDVHYRLIRRDGSFLWASVSWQPIFGLDGAYLGWRSCHRDVTDRVQAEEALRLSEAALQAAQKVAHVGSWSWHIPVGRVDWSEEMFRIFGVSKEQFSGNLADIVASTIHPEDRAAVNRVNEAVITEYRHSPLEFRIVRPDGSVRVAWAEAGELTLDKHGRSLLLTGIVQDITERKQAQQALQISLQTSADIVRTIPSGLFIYQFEPPDRLILVSGNPEAERLTGVRVDRFKGREFNELWPQAKGLGHTARFLDVMRTGRTLVSDDMQYPGEGTAAFLRVRAFVLPQNRLAVAFDDVTERRKAEQNLREREEVYSAIVNQAADSIVLVDAGTWRFVEFNDAACQGLGYTREEFARITLREIQGVLPDSEVARPVREIMQTGRAALESRQRRKDGTFRDALVSHRLVHIRGRDYFVGVWRDITERKKVEEALRESRERFRSLYESVQAGVIVQRADGTISHCNRIACETFGIAEEDVRSRASRQLFWHMTKEDGTSVADADYPSTTTLRTGKPIRGVVRGFFSKDPERMRWLLINTEPRFKTDSRELDEVIVTFQDITEQKREQQQAEQRQAELLHVSRLGTLGEMASGFAHELNQPLSAIMSYASASLRSVQMGQFDVSRLTTNLGHIVAQSGRAGEIIRRVRAFAQRRPLRAGPLDVNATVREAVDLLGVDIRHKGVELTLDLSAGLPSVFGDSIQIEQVLLNLMRNAVEAMEAVAPQQRRLLLRTFSQSHDAVAVSVSDTGPGMGEEMMAKAFDPFFTTKEKGLGIGLSISRSIIESHRGQFWVASGSNEGCTFTFTLPAAAPADQNTAT